MSVNPIALDALADVGHFIGMLLPVVIVIFITLLICVILLLLTPSGNGKRDVLSQVYWFSQHKYLYKIFNIKLGSKVLELGSAYGMNLQLFSKDSIGVEANPKLVKYSRLLGLKVVKANIEEGLGEIKDTFSLIWMTDVLAHTISPYKVLYDCRRLLKKKGRIVLQIPISSLWDTHKSPCHFYSFTQDTLEYLCEMAGYKVTDYSGMLRCLPNWLNYFLEPLLQCFGVNCWLLLEKQESVPVCWDKTYPPKWFKKSGEKD